MRKRSRGSSCDDTLSCDLPTAKKQRTSSNKNEQDTHSNERNDQNASQQLTTSTSSMSREYSESSSDDDVPIFLLNRQRKRKRSSKSEAEVTPDRMDNNNNETTVNVQKNQAQSISIFDKFSNDINYNDDIQCLIEQFADTNYENISFIPIDTAYDQYVGSITYNVTDGVYPKYLGIFKFDYDVGYKVMSIRDEEEQEFEETDYYHQNKHAFINKVFPKLLHFIFEYKYKHCYFRTVDIVSEYIESHKINSFGNYVPYILDNKHYFLTAPKSKPIFDGFDIQQYECTILIKNDPQYFVLNDSHEIYGNAVQFERKCFIYQQDDESAIEIYFNEPITYITHERVSDISFKLRINDINIAGKNFFFSDNYSNDDWHFRINKYTYTSNVEQWYIHHTHYHSIHSYHFVASRFRTGDTNEYYGYSSFEKNIRNHNQLEITSLDNLDDETKKIFFELRDLVR